MQYGNPSGGETIRNLITFSDPPYIKLIQESGLGPFSRVDQVSLGEVNRIISEHRQVAFKWTENIYVPDHLWRACTPQVYSPAIPNSLARELNLLSEWWNFVAIRKINSKVGYGVFALQRIPKGTCLFIYSGTVCKFAEPVSYPGGSQSLRDYYLYHLKDNLYVSAQQRGGIASFLQHMLDAPSDEIFTAYKRQSSVVFANLVREDYNYHNILDVIYFKAIEDIPVGAQLGIYCLKCQA